MYSTLIHSGCITKYYYSCTCTCCISVFPKVSYMYELVIQYNMYCIIMYSTAVQKAVPQTNRYVWVVQVRTYEYLRTGTYGIFVLSTYVPVCTYEYSYIPGTTVIVQCIKGCISYWPVWPLSCTFKEKLSYMKNKVLVRASLPQAKSTALIFWSMDLYVPVRTYVLVRYKYCTSTGT